jgi:hypothetical protein
MAMIGNFQYPDVDIQSCRLVAWDIHNSFQDEATRQGLAEYLGHSTNSGRYSSKLSALRQFGLIEGHGIIRLTDLGVKLAIEKGDNLSVVLWQAILTVPLFHYLYDRMTGTIRDRGFFVDALQTITGLGRLDVLGAMPSMKKHLDRFPRWVERSLLEDNSGVEVTELKLHSVPHTNESVQTPLTLSEPLQQQQETNSKTITVYVDGATFTSPLTQRGLRMAQDFLASLYPTDSS